MRSASGLGRALRKNPLVPELCITELQGWAVESHVWLPLGSGHRLAPRMQPCLEAGNEPDGPFSFLLLWESKVNWVWGEYHYILLILLLFLFPSAVLWDLFSATHLTRKCPKISSQKHLRGGTYLLPRHWMHSQDTKC